MKNAHLFLIAGMAVVVFGGYVLTRSEPPVTTASRRAPTDSARPTAPGGSSPQLAGRSFGHAPQVTTDVRASIFDAPDIYAAVKRAPRQRYRG